MNILLRPLKLLHPISAGGIRNLTASLSRNTWLSDYKSATGIKPALSLGTLIKDASSWNGHFTARGQRIPDWQLLRSDHEQLTKDSKELERLNQIKNRNLHCEAAGELKPARSRMKRRTRELESKCLKFAFDFPNRLADDVPTQESVVIQQQRVPTTDVMLAAKTHLQKTATGTTGRPQSLEILGQSPEDPLLELAMLDFVMREAVDAGFFPIRLPNIIRHQYYYACGDMAYGNSADDLQQLENDLCMAPATYVPVAVSLTGSRIPEFPHDLVAYGTSYTSKSDASLLREDSPNLRNAQESSNIELFSVTRPTDSAAKLEELVAFQLKLLKGLGFARLRVVDLAAPKLAPGAARSLSVEVYSPELSCWSELTRASNFTDYQSRRLLIREAKGSMDKYSTVLSFEDDRQGPLDVRVGKEFVHTLHATAVSMPKVMQALAAQNGGLTVEGAPFG